MPEVTAVSVEVDAPAAPVKYGEGLDLWAAIAGARYVSDVRRARRSIARAAASQTIGPAEINALLEACDGKQNERTYTATEPPLDEGPSELSQAEAWTPHAVLDRIPVVTGVDVRACQLPVGDR